MPGQRTNEMRWAIPLLLVMQLPAAELKVDHVTIAGRDLAVWQKAFDAAGITCEFGGKHTNGMTEMAVASFPDGSYLELIAAQPGAELAKHYWGRFIDQDAGACAWAVSVKSISAEAKRLHAAGIDLKPVASGRKRPDGVELRWTTATVGPPPQGSFFPFLIEDHTPRALRVYPHGSPSVKTLDGVALVVITVRDLDAAVAKWRATFGLPPPQRQDDTHLGAHLAWFPGTPVVLASPLKPGDALAVRIDKFGEAPVAFVLRAPRLPANAATSRGTWFGHPIGWFDPAALRGAQIGVIIR
jgi:catechol 2,3-dioxygenase-like lactoylglutathione lyase family enzyme